MVGSSRHDLGGSMLIVVDYVDQGAIVEDCPTDTYGERHARVLARKAFSGNVRWFCFVGAGIKAEDVARAIREQLGALDAGQLPEGATYQAPTWGQMLGEPRDFGGVETPWGIISDADPGL